MYIFLYTFLYNVARFLTVRERHHISKGNVRMNTVLMNYSHMYQYELIYLIDI